MLLGGTLKAEVVLALANLLWFVGSAIGSLVVVDRHLPDVVVLLARLSPSGALTEALIRATTGGGFDLFGIAVLLVWGVLGATAAVRLFRFTG